MNPTDDLTPDQRQAMVQQWAKQTKKSWGARIGLGGAIGIGIAGLIVISAVAGSDDDDEGGKKMTLTEAACKLLREGEDSEFTYSVMKDLAADHPLVYGEDESIAARLAVEQAQAQGC